MGRCIVIEFGWPPLKPFWFRSRLMYRVGIGPIAIAWLRMTLYDYEQEVESGKTQWVKYTVGKGAGLSENLKRRIPKDITDQLQADPAVYSAALVLLSAIEEENSNEVESGKTQWMKEKA